MGRLVVPLVSLALLALLVLSPARPSAAQSFGEDRPLVFERLAVEVELPRRPGMGESERQALMSRLSCYRACVPGGWLVMSPNGGVTFLPDAAHAWDGASAPR